MKAPGGPLPRGSSDDPERVSAELREEMEAHILHRIDDLVAEGVEPAKARARAEAEFGDPSRFERAVVRAHVKTRRLSRFAGWIEDLSLDLRYAFRQLKRGPAFALVAVLTLALGIGSTVTIGSVVDAVVLEPLPFSEPDRLVEILAVTPGDDDFSVSEPAFLDWTRRLERFEGVGALAWRGATLRAPGEPTSITRGYASAGFFDLIGTGLLAGREFAASEDRPWAGAAIAIVSESFWTTRFDRSPELEGRTVQLDALTFDVVGVYPDELDILFGGVPVVTPLAASPEMDRGEHYLTVVARLGPGMTLSQAQADLDLVADWQSASFEEDRGWSARADLLETKLIGESTRRAGWVLLAAAGLLLAMACLNVSSLLLARASVRTTEMGVRAALGAARARMGRQLLTESAVLAAFGGGIGLAGAALTLPVIRAMGDGRIPRLGEAEIDLGVGLTALAVTALATLLFGSAPILSLLRRRALVTSASRGSSRGRSRIRSAFVVGQLATSLVLLVGTGLLFRSFVGLTRIDPGFEAEGTLVAALSMPDGTWGWEERGPLMRNMLEAVEGVPGVIRAGATAVDPFGGSALANFVAREDRMPDRAEEFTPMQWRAVTPGFVEAMGMRVLAGRSFERSDADLERWPAIIDAGLARILFGSPSAAIGETLVWGDPGGSRMSVVGVVEPFRDVELAREPDPMVYRLYDQIPWASMTLVVRVREGVPLAPLSGRIRSAVQGAAPGLPVPELGSLQDNLDRALAEPRFNVSLLAGFAFAGLLLAVVGLYGLTAFEVRQRMREIGIRMSLGARPEGILRMIVRERMVMTAVGLGI
ncbi:MAG: FtsX-like permease family protein, partial [Gemmatimonadetes bacterium]|nr:FtsX-like permease family protein [Gemmatimonadota bacterium]